MRLNSDVIRIYFVYLLDSFGEADDRLVLGHQASIIKSKERPVDVNNAKTVAGTVGNIGLRT